MLRFSKSYDSNFRPSTRCRHALRARRVAFLAGIAQVAASLQHRQRPPHALRRDDQLPFTAEVTMQVLVKLLVVSAFGLIVRPRRFLPRQLFAVEPPLRRRRAAIDRTIR